MSFPNKKGIVYSMEFPNGKKYVGVTTIGLRKRMNNHKAKSNHSTEILKAIKQFGFENVKVDIVDNFLCKEEAVALEKKYIKELDCIKNGYNISLGGFGANGVLATDEKKFKLSEAQKKRFEKDEERKKTSIAIKKWIEENPDKRKEDNQKRKESMSTLEYREKISKIRSKTANEHPEIGENHSKFMLDRYRKNPNLKLQVSKQKGGRPVEVYKDGEKIAEYEMVSDCAKELGLNTGNIAMVLKGTRRHTKGYTFKRKEE